MSPQVDFYILTDPGPDATEKTACRIAEKAWLRSHRIYVHTASAHAAERVNDLLWTFRQGSFVPHELSAPGADPATPVLVGHLACPAGMDDVLINLGLEVPAFFVQFQRVVELVAADEEARRAGRERWREYKAHGCEIQSHNV